MSKIGPIIVIAIALADSTFLGYVIGKRTVDRWYAEHWHKEPLTFIQSGQSCMVREFSDRWTIFCILAKGEK